MNIAQSIFLLSLGLVTELCAGRFTIAFVAIECRVD